MRSTLRVLSALLACIGVVATSASAGTEQTSSAPPPVGRVLREIPPGAKSVIVFVSVGGKEYAATAGTSRPKARSALSHRERDEDVHGHDRVPARAGGEASARQHAGRAPAGRRPKGRRDHDPAPAPAPLGARERHGLSGMAQPGGTVALDQSHQDLALCGLQAAGVPARQPDALLEHELHRARSRDREGRGTLVRRRARGAHPRSARSLRTELPTTRRLPDLDDAGYNPNLPWAAGAIVSNAHDLSRFYSALLSGRLLSAASLGAMKDTKTDGVFSTGLGIFSTNLACGRSWGHDGYIVDYQTLVIASEEGERVAVVSLRGRGYIPWLGRALLCAEPPLAAGSGPAKSRIAFTSSVGPGSQPAVRRQRRRERAAVASAQRVRSPAPSGRRTGGRSPSRTCVTATARSTS